MISLIFLLQKPYQNLYLIDYPQFPIHHVDYQAVKYEDGEEQKYRPAELQERSENGRKYSQEEGEYDEGQNY